jgi:hypothetical protein
MGILITLMPNVLGLGVNIITEPGLALEFILGPFSILIGNVEPIVGDDDE